MLKLSENPPPLCPGVDGIDGVEGTWWVAHTKPRQEKALAWEVLRSGGGYFLPMYEIVRTSARRSWKAMLLLFPGYVFLCGDARQRQRALESNRIANALRVANQAELVAELSAIRQVLVSKRGFDPYSSLARGTACRIRSGPFAGLLGRVVRRKGRTRFVLNVTILGQGVAVEIDADMLDPC